MPREVTGPDWGYEIEQLKLEKEKIQRRLKIETDNVTTLLSKAKLSGIENEIRENEERELEHKKLETQRRVAEIDNRTKSLEFELDSLARKRKLDSDLRRIEIDSEKRILEVESRQLEKRADQLQRERDLMRPSSNRNN